MTDEFPSLETLKKRRYEIYLNHMFMLGLHETVAIIGGNEALEKRINPPDWTKHIRFT